ncbi:12_t:CDS:2, partial [Cetraspora pellucida]
MGHHFNKPLKEKEFSKDCHFRKLLYVKSMPQDMYMDLENLNNVMSSQEIFKGEPIFEKSKIFIPDLENLDDEKYPPKVT